MNKKMSAERWNYIKQLAPPAGRYVVGGPHRPVKTIVTVAKQRLRASRGLRKLNSHEVSAGY